MIKNFYNQCCSFWICDFKCESFVPFWCQTFLLFFMKIWFRLRLISSSTLRLVWRSSSLFHKYIIYYILYIIYVFGKCFTLENSIIHLIRFLNLFFSFFKFLSYFFNKNEHKKYSNFKSFKPLWSLFWKLKMIQYVVYNMGHLYLGLFCIFFLIKNFRAHSFKIFQFRR
jgi:hypothetical protein